ncbi:glycoside hydrolase family 3 protein [Isoptericola hypogeus]
MAYVLPPGPGGSVELGPVRHHLEAHRISHFAVMGPASPQQMADLAHAIADAGREAELPVPVTLSSDPRQVSADRPGHAAAASGFSEWPEPLGIAALRDPDTAFLAGRATGEEFRAAGLHVLLGPQLDVLTELRWARGTGTFGGDPELVIETAGAYLRGLHGDNPKNRVSAVVKHFPGAGPQLDGEDSHFAYGKDQAYPGGHFETHLRPFEALLGQGVTQVMPYYSRPIGIGLEEVGFAFNKEVITGLLRERLGFDGVVLSDFGILTDHDIMGETVPARAWGLEDADVHTRVLRALEAGVDQFGGEAVPEVVVQLVEDSRISEERIDQSVRRILLEKERLGLLDDAAPRPLAEERREQLRVAGLAAQRRAVTVLKGGWPAVPESAPAVSVSATGEVDEELGDATAAVVLAEAPSEPRSGFFESMFPAGSLDFPDAQVAEIVDICRRMPTVVAVDLTRPAVLTPIVDEAAGLVVHYGCSRSVILEVVRGGAPGEGRLPVQLPRSMADVLDGDLDAPLDIEDPLFEFGAGAAPRNHEIRKGTER